MSNLNGLLLVFPHLKSKQSLGPNPHQSNTVCFNQFQYLYFFLIFFIYVQVILLLFWLKLLHQKANYLCSASSDRQNRAEKNPGMNQLREGLVKAFIEEGIQDVAVLV